MQLPLPAALLRQLVEEWERVTKQGLLPALPRRPCVDELLDQYKASGVCHRQPCCEAGRWQHPPPVKPLRVYSCWCRVSARVERVAHHRMPGVEAIGAGVRDSSQYMQMKLLILPQTF